MIIKKNFELKNNEKAFTLLEVLVFLSIFLIFFITAITIVIATFNRLKSQEYKILAVRYSEELLEWLRGKKEEDWNNFINYAGINGAKKMYCFSQTPINNSWPSEINDADQCPFNGLNPPIYQRIATLAVNNQNNQVSLDITVKWREGNNNLTVPIKTIFTVWE